MRLQIIYYFTILIHCGLGQKISEITPSNHLKNENGNLNVRINFEKPVNEEERKAMKVILIPSTSSSCQNITIKDQTKAQASNMESVEFIYPSKNINCFCIYNITFVNNSTETATGFRIYIYQYELKLKMPKDRYFLIDESEQIVTALYEFDNDQSSDAINTITCFNDKNEEKKNIVDFSIESKILKVRMKASTTPVDYKCNIFPLYSTNSIPDYQQFKLCFHEYLLLTEAIYFESTAFDTDIIDNNNITFKIKFKDEFNKENLVIQDFYDNPINYIEDCKDKICDFYISEGELNQPGKYSLFYKQMQERELFYILYQKIKFKKCYYKSKNEPITIFFIWYKDMDYMHHIYLNSTNNKSIEYYLVPPKDPIVGNYTITSSELNVGLFSMKSSIPALNLTDYNPVNPDRFYFSIIDDIAVYEQMNITLFKNNRTKQILNLTFSERDTIGVLDEIRFLPKTIEKPRNLYFPRPIKNVNHRIQLIIYAI